MVNIQFPVGRIKYQQCNLGKKLDTYPTHYFIWIIIMCRKTKAWNATAQKLTVQTTDSNNSNTASTLSWLDVGFPTRSAYRCWLVWWGWYSVCLPRILTARQGMLARVWGYLLGGGCSNATLRAARLYTNTNNITLHITLGVCTLQ